MEIIREKENIIFIPGSRKLKQFIKSQPSFNTQIFQTHYELANT